MICSTCKASNTEAARLCANCGVALNVEGVTPLQSDRAAQEGALVDREGGPLLGSTILGKYRIDAKLGAGGMGIVYRATRLLIGDEVAIKILYSEHTDPRAAERFRREAQAAARLKHPNAVTIHDFGVTDDGLQYLVMELLEGLSLRQIIKQEGPLSPSVAAEITTQVCAALDEAHQRHVVHRDIKPDNIIINSTTAGLRVKVLDFGIAKLRDDVASHLTQTGSVMGTPHYMSPEQCLG
jgi:serine/threonine protein kinase